LLKLRAGANRRCNETEQQKMKYPWIHIAWLLLPPHMAQAQARPPVEVVAESTDWKAIAKQLEEMLDTDQMYRKKVSEFGRQGVSGSAPAAEGESVQEWLEKQRAADKANQGKLKEIIAKHGWPPRSAVGPKASTAAWAVLQHAEMSFQVEAAPLLRKAVASGEASKSQLALLEDRLLIRQNRPQLYGSQINGTGMTLYPIQDESALDQRRAEVGLEPICDYLKRFASSGPKIRYQRCEAQ
jgi:hypothetical protein